MRLFEKCWTQLDATQREWFRQQTCVQPPAAILDIDILVEHYNSLADPKTSFTPDEFPYARAPWDTTFAEFRMMPEGTDVGILLNRLKPGGERDYKIRDLQKTWSGLPAGAAEKVRMAEDALSAVFVFCSQGKRPMIAPIEAIILLSRDGYLQEEIVALEVPDQQLSGLTVPALLAFNFANCKNVTLEDDTDTDTPPKIRRRLNLPPEVRRYCLNICGHSTKRRPNGAADPQKDIMPYHFCRGHFRTYTAKRPMFGRFGNPNMIGKFWDPPRMRGKRERGEVIKDYAISVA